MNRNEYSREWYAQRKRDFCPAMNGTMTCKKCNVTKKVTKFGTHPNMANGRRTTCKKCRSAETVKWFNHGGGKELRTIEKKRQYKKTQIARYPDKHKARIAVMNAVARGTLVAKEFCERCGDSDLLHGHHAHYSKPLDVEWLCIPCHTAEHKEDEN